VLAETIRGPSAHRSGSIDGEGDGSGILCDIPRDLWADALPRAPDPCRSPTIRGRVVFLPAGGDEIVEPRSGGSRAASHPICSSVTDDLKCGLGKRAEGRRAGSGSSRCRSSVRRGGPADGCIASGRARETPATIVSLSARSLAAARHRNSLPRTSPISRSAVPHHDGVRHNRYATNTTSFERAQPFAALRTTARSTRSHACATMPTGRARATAAIRRTSMRAARPCSAGASIH
jgi:glutamate synthase (NADPH/NADH) large chain